MGLNAALATASRSLDAFTAGIQVAGQNIANANTPGYIRETLQLEPGRPYLRGGLLVGTGVSAPGIQQEIDQYLETRIHSANSDVKASKARESIYKQLEAEIRELGDGDLSSRLNGFLAAINDVVNQPESAAVRQLAVGEGRQLASDISSLNYRIQNLRKVQSVKVESLVEEANELIDQVQTLNVQITRLESAGLLRSDAGASRTLRYNALSRLSEIIPIQYIERQNGAVDVFTNSGSDYLVLGGQTQFLETTTSVDRGISVTNVQLSQTKAPITASGGELRGVIEGRDGVLGGFLDQLDTYTSNLIFEFNRIHSSGEGFKGHTSLASTHQVDDTTVALDSAGLDFTPQHGSFQLKLTNLMNGITQTTNVSIDLDGIGTDTTLDDLQAAIDAVANVSATITTDRRLKLDADTNFEIRFGDDTSGVLATLGINTFFTGADSSDIGINQIVANNHEFFATSKGGGPSDGRNAVDLAEFIDKPVDGLADVSLDRFYNSTISSLAQASASETAIALGFEGFRESLMNQRQQISGVSLDEEAIQILEFQRAFQASARLISTIDELFTELLSM